MEITVGESPADATFTSWAAPHLGDLWRFAVSLVGFDRAEDLFQDTLTRAWVKRDQFDPSRGSARSWLFAIMADRARRGWQRRSRDIPIHLHPSNLRSCEEPSSSRLDLRHAVGALPRRQRTAVILFYYLDLPVAEIAELMTCSVGTVKSTLHDARNALAERLGDSYA